MLQNKRILIFSFTIALFTAFTLCAYSATRESCIQAIISQTNIDYVNEDESILTSYTDGEEVEGGKRKCVSAALKNGIITGYQDGSLRPHEEITRAEFACILYRAKDFFKSPPQHLVDYTGGYSDTAGWNEKEILFCIESGYLMGYGDAFGADDIITSEQLEIVRKRVEFGLSVREKYTLFEVCGCSPISLRLFLASRYNDELKYTVWSENPQETVVSYNSPEIAEKLEKLLEMQGNMDYERLSVGEHRKQIEENFRDDFRMYHNILVKKIYGETTQVTTIEKMVQNAKEQKIQRDSIFVLAPEYNKIVMASFMYRRVYGTGYEYYCYRAIDGETPNEEKIGTWYRRRVDVDLLQPTSQGDDILTCRYSTPEILK